MFNQQQIYLCDRIQTRQTGGQPYSDTSPYEVSECSLTYLYKYLLRRSLITSKQGQSINGMISPDGEFEQPLCRHLFLAMPSHLPTYLPISSISRNTKCKELPTYLTTYLPTYLRTYLPTYLPISSISCNTKSKEIFVQSL